MPKIRISPETPKAVYIVLTRTPKDIKEEKNAATHRQISVKLVLSFFTWDKTATPEDAAVVIIAKYKMAAQNGLSTGKTFPDRKKNGSSDTHDSGKRAKTKVKRNRRIAIIIPPKTPPAKAFLREVAFVEQDRSTGAETAQL